VALSEASRSTLQHLELAERFLTEGRELVDKDPVQASEKLYKVAEKAAKTIAVALKLPETEEVAKRDGRTAGLLENALVNTTRRLELDELYYWWDYAYKLRVDGFHEAVLRSGDVRLRLRDVEALVNLAKNALEA